MDAVYGFETLKIASLYGILTIGGVIVYVILQWLKEHMLVSAR